MNEKRWSLVDAFDLSLPGQLVAIVGGGGKSSLMFALAEQVPGQVVMTTTTRIFAAQIQIAPVALMAGAPSPEDWPELSRSLARHGTCLITGPLAGEKATGVPADWPGRILSRPDVDYVIVEADGSRIRPVKAPARHEPVIPPASTLLVPSAGIDALDGPIAEKAHRPELVAALTGLKTTDWLSPETLARLLTDPEGGLKALPDQAKVIPLLNKVEEEPHWAAARQTARFLLQNERIDRVVLGALRRPDSVSEVQSRVTAVVLAAGESQRMGQTKQLLPWGNTTVLGQTLANLSDSLVHEILVVTGHEHQAVARIAAAFNAATIHNPAYAQGGMLSSLQVAIRALAQDRSAVLVMLADQPMVRPSIIDRILIEYWRRKGRLVAPEYQGQRGNPVLIDQAHFAGLLALPHGAAPRALLQQQPDDIYLVPVDDPAVTQDLDRPADYQRWRPA